MRHPTRNTNTYGARPRGGSRFSLAYFGRLMSCLLALSLILNSFTFTVEDFGVAIAQTADTAEYGADVLEEEEKAVEELQDVDLGLEEGNDQETADQDAYLFNAGYDSEFLFSRIMDDAKLPIKKVKDVEMISVMGSLDEQDPDSKQETGEALYVEPILNDKNEISDYSITALRFFEEAGLMVYTADDYYTVRLWRPDDAAKEMEKRAQQAQALPEETEEPVPEATAEPVYEIGAAWPERLGTVLESVGLPIKPTEVENVAVLGDGDGEPDPLTVEAVDGDYLISVTRDFDEARLALYLGEEVCVLTLINGIGAEPVEETEVDVPEEPEADPVDEAVEEPVKETEIDLPTEDETETTEEIDEVEEPTEELTEETEVELIAEPTAEPTEEPTVEPTEEPTAEPTEEPMLEPTEEPTAEPAPEPTEEPEADLVEEPTEAPTVEPTEEPTPEPTEEPTEVAYPAQHFTGSTVFVRVDVDAPEGAFPEGATMAVKPVWNSDTIADFTDAVSADNMEVDRCLVVDITFYDADGNEIEPLAPVAVEMSMAARMNEEQEALVAHMDDTGAVELMEQTEVAESTGSRVAMSVEIGTEQTEVEYKQTEVGDADETTVAFDADGFSMYALMLARYTVDFHWGDYIYNIEGEGEITLSSLLEKLGVTEITSADVANVTFSNPEYIAIEQLDSDWLLRSLAPFSTEEALTLTLQNGQSVEIKVTDEQQEEPAPTPVTNLVYNGQPQALVTNVEGGTYLYALVENGETAPENNVSWNTTVPSATDAGTYYVWYKADGSDAAAQCVTAAIARMPLTITADSAEKAYDGSPLTKDTYTYTKPAEGDTMQSVTISGSQEHMGSSDNVPSAAVINNTSNEDVTANYDITYVNGTLTVTWPENMVAKELTAFNGNLATYTITVNPAGDVMTGGQNYIVKDTFSRNQSINYGSVTVSPEENVTYDFSEQTGTYTIPDGAKVTITYTTRVAGQVGKPANFYNTAVVGSMGDSGFVPGPTATVNETRTISPTGTDISGTGGVYSIDLFAYADGHMERGLSGAEFRLLDSNMRPMHYLAGENAGKEIKFTTGEDGTVTIRLNHESDGLAIQKNTVYFLEMATAPYEEINGENVYYQKDDTFYSFLITDEPSYKYGDIYSYFNGDVLKVRCYPEAEGINVTKRFSGNYTLTDEQKNAITFTLQKEAQYTASGWVDVESHTYADFSYGSINFNTGRKGGTELEDFATYRIIEEHARPEALADTIDENVSVTVSYQQGGKRVTENSNEFTVDPDEKLAFSYDFAFTNEYVDHKLTLIKIDENTGAPIPGAIFSVYTADNTETTVATYTTGKDGSITIRRSDEGAGYAPDTLYYVVESKAPEGYVLPADPEKIYFYFSENGGGVPAGLPSGKTATDLTTSYNTVTLPNSSASVNVPVTAVWGVGTENISKVVVGLYKSVGGATAEKVLDNNSEALTLELTKEKYYDTTTFVNLPAQEDGKNIVYSVVVKGVFAPDDADITTQFAQSVSVSGTGWYVVKNEPAVSVVVQKQWFEQDGTTPVSDTSGRAAVTFDLYRTTTEAEGNFNRAELVAFLADAEKVRTGLTLSKESWSTTIDSLQSKDRQDNTYYYYALENPIPDNQEDSYLVAPAVDSAPRTLTIKNTQTPVTVTIKAGDLTKTYGDEDPKYPLTASVMQDEASAVITGPDASGHYTATVTDPQSESKTIKFTVSRDEGENVGAYTITPTGEASQAGYRVLFETGKLTISSAEVTITAGASKVYGEDDPALVTVTGLKNNETAGSGDSDTVKYTVSREEGEDVGDYPITLTGESDQGNYRVTYDSSNAVFRIGRAQATVTANAASKVYGEDDPELTATVTGLQRGDEASVLNYELTREAGENVGTYSITSAGEAEQGNYTVTYAPAEFTITPAALTVKVVNTEKTYGDEDPEWEVEIDGLYRDEEGGTLNSVLDEATGVRTYTYTLSEGDEAVSLLTFTITRTAGESVGNYPLTPTGAETQGNYTLTFEPGTLSIERAELFVTADHVVKAVGVETDPLLTATVTGWKNGDDPLEDTTLFSTETDENGTVTRTYKRGSGAAEVTFLVISSVGADGTVTWTYKRGDTALLTFTLKRDASEEEGEYPITVSGGQNQSNYSVEYEQGSFGILSILDVDVKQPVIDYADTDAAPSYTYTAKLDLTGTGLVEYEKNGFTRVDGVPTLTFTLPDENKADTMTLKVPGGAKLTVEQTSTNDDYDTALSLDGNPYTNPNNAALCILEHVDTYHEMAFTHSRISYPVEARVSETQSEEGAKKLEGRKGAMGIPTGDELTRAIDADFADDMHSKIGYVLPTDKYYMYDHASLYTAAGEAIEGASHVSAIKYDRENAKWQYKVGEGDFVDAPENAQLVLFYLPKFVCKIGTEKFYSLRAAVDYVVNNAETNGTTATIEMLIGDYTIRSSNDAVTIPEGYTITITTAQTEYEGEGTAVISRSMNYTAGHLFYNDGRLTFDNIILDGKNVQATDALVLNRDANSVLTVNAGATMQNAKGVNGGAIYVKNGTVTVNGTLTNNEATNGGGAVYVKAGTFTIGASGKLSGNSAMTGGAVYVDDGTVNIVGTIGGTGAESNTATIGGAVYINKGTVSVTGSVIGNTAENGGAVYQVGGTLTVNGSMAQNTASVNGGAVYLSNGTLTNNGTIDGNSATGNGGAVYQVGGTLSNEGTISGNNASNGGGIYRVGGTLTVGGILSGNEADEEGGAIHSTNGTLNVNAAVTGNHAATGGAVYVSGATLNINGGSFSQNTATANGGAVYALNSTTRIGSADAEVTVENNTSEGNGGAVYMEGGSVTVENANSTLTGNSAINGGGIYATSGAITVDNGRLESNEATANGGAIYAESASVTVNGGVLGGTGKGNKANQGNGGAIYAGSGTVTVSDGTLSGNSAGRGESEDTTLGLGGAIYAGTGTVNYTGGAINGGNSAVNGAAIFVGSGIANVSASITGNTATNGGAIGVGGTSARLNFKGSAEVNNNTMNGAQSNVYLDVDSELVVNADSLNNGKKIGIYVPGDVNGDQVVKHGDVTGYFGAYVSAGTLANIPNVFKSDRFSDLKVAYENNRVYWISELKYDIYYLKNYTTSKFPPTSNYLTESTKVCSNKDYAPRTRTSDIYDLVMAMKLYEKHVTDFENKVDKTKYASLAVYAYTFSDKAMGNNFENYLKTIRWDGTARKWMYDKQDGTTAPADTTKLVIFYSAPAYLTIVNNNTSNLELDISGLTVLGKDATDGVYGFVTAKNGATVTTLRTLTADDLKLGVGDSIKLMFPGAQGQSFTIRGEFVGSGEGEIKYTFNGGAEQTISGTTVDLSSYSLNTNDEAAELVFGDALPICKIGNEPFSTLKAAMDYAVAQKAATGSNTYKIEMLVDYLVPKDDVLDIPDGYNITFTTADRDAETLPYTGNGTRATLSRDTGNSGSSVSATNSILTVDNLAFDGRSLTAGGKGGAISTTNCATVTITNSEFKGYRADNGGAIYVDNRNAGSSLTVEHCDFSNCQTNASVDKAGGGALWTTARELYVRNCTFDFCACLKGNAQAGSIFHNIRSGWASNSKTVISDCTFSNSYSVGGSGGTIETDALDVTIENCRFRGSYTNKSKGNGGAINALAGDTGASGSEGYIGTYNSDCWLTVRNCLFEECRAANSGNGGAIVSSMWYVTIENCKFDNCQSKYGGAIKMTNGNAKWLHINGSTFKNCTAADVGGGVHAAVPSIEIKKSNAGKFLDNTDNDGSTHFIDCVANRGGGIDNNKDGATVTMENVDFNRCAARSSNGGALYTKAQTLSITGDANTFTDCTGYGSGGAVYQLRNADKSSVTLENCTFTGCEANNNGNGGGLYANAMTLTVNYDTANDSAIEGAKGSFVNCTAANAGGGLYHDYAGTAKIANCGFEGCTAKTTTGGGLYTSAHTLKIIGVDSKFKNCTAQTDGGGLYHNRDANGSTLTFKDGSFESCTATGNYGGAIYTKVKGTVTLEGGTVKDSTAKAQGGGIYFANGNTASFDSCTITGNTVTNSDSKGGGVYVAGGTTTYKSGTVSGCSAAYGGGWYQNNGNLYILGGSISGSATVNGGGLYINDSKAWVRQYSGTVAGTAAGNGGGIYENAGNYTIGDATYEGTAYSGASVGTVTVDEGGSPVYTATAVNGGGIYQNTGTIYQNAGSRIVGQASANGGGLYVGGALQFNGGLITNCMASANGGGIYYASTTSDLNFYADADSKIQNCRAANGGGVYMNSAKTFHIGQKDQNSIGTIENCHATANGGGLYQTSGTCNLRNASIIQDCTAVANGGGVYHAGGTFNIYGTSRIEHCKAEDNGGGLYSAGGILTFEGGSIIRNMAEENGGGVYHAGGTFNMTSKGAVIGGSTENANTANVGAGVFVADGQTATFSDNSAKALEISYNHAVTAGGGIAVGGPNALLDFYYMVTVRHNTMGSQNAECNVYLDQNRNTVIKNKDLNVNAYIGVYTSDAQDAGHGVPGKPFATYNNTNNLNVYHNDRRPYLYGMKGSSNNEVIWPEFVCKINDGEGNLLYKDANGTPAVYSELENIGASGAFSALNTSATPDLYRLNEDGTYSKYTDEARDGYQVQMLVQEYALGSGRQIKLDQSVERKIVLTTASTDKDECGFGYTGDARFAATIKRTAPTSAMVFVGGGNQWELTLSNITLDGNEQAATQEGAILRIENKGTAILGDGATLQNGLTANKAGGAVYLNDTGCAFTMNAGSQIKDCSAGTSNGGAVAVNNGTFTMNGGSSITGCSAANGGGVYLNNSGRIVMNGGTITGNNATSQGGGIALVHGNSRATFSDYCIVTDNTLNGTTRCNVQFNQDNNLLINANGLDGRSEIGIYTAGLESNTGSIYYKHGLSGKPFGTWAVNEDNLFCFVNDRSTNLRGFQSAKETDTRIFWEYHPLLTVTKDVSSDLSADKNTAEFTFQVQLPAGSFDKNSTKYGDMTFNKTGLATVKLKAGQSATAILPDTFDKVAYDVTEVLSEDQSEDYTATAERNGTAYPFTEAKPLTVSGTLGENIGTENSTSLSEVVFTNTRATGDLTVSKQVISEVEDDKEESFAFTLTLKDTGISKTYKTIKKDAENNATEGTLTFTAGVSDAFSLKHGESLTIKGLPTDLEYTVEEKLTDAQKAQIRTQVSKNRSEPVYAVKQEGTIGEHSTTTTVEDEEKTVYASEVAFINNFLEIVCKITNRSRALLYYRDAAGNLQPAIFAHLEDAFDQINSGNLRTSSNGTVSGQLRIEMVVPQYTMERTATLNSGKTVLLSTALPSDADYPYNKGESDGDNISTVYRGFEKGGMIVDNGALTIDRIVLDGGGTSAATTANGGIVCVAGRVRLTVNSDAKLQNSVTSGNGGAIWLGSGASLTMNGTISNCSAASGGGVYASNGFTTITTTGTITGCKATSGDGGAIYASTGTSVNLNAGTALTGNTATGNGGAVYTGANLILRGSVGGIGTDEGNTADGNGGGIYMGEGTTFTMYAGSSVSGNTATNGGGLATLSTARIAGGTLQGNEANQKGGAVYATADAAVTISGAPVLTQNKAALGGAVYDGGTVTMTGGTMTGNTATEKGGAVYVEAGRRFTMSGGTIKDGNKSPEGAVSTAANATLAFSGNAVVSGNTDSDGTTAKNVYLGHDSNAIITSSGLGSSANIGVYVANGKPETSDSSDPNYRADHVNNPIYADHGVSGRDFGTYTGSNLSGAKLNKFVNDRDPSLTGMSGSVADGTQYIAWIGKGLELQVTQYLIQTDEDGNPVLDDDRNPVLSEKQVPVQNASFTFTRADGVQVWSGKSGKDGIVTIPWGGNETAGGNVASFVPGSVYRLDQTAAAEKTVLPAGHWKVTIGRDNSVTWEMVPVEGAVDRTLEIVLPEKAYLGETFGLKNDVKPTLTYNAMNGKLSDGRGERTDTIAFTTKETSHSYEIRETNPTRESHVFKAWATMDKKPEGEKDAELTEEELTAKGYFEYAREDNITFYRGTDSADPAVKYAQSISKGDMTLYAQWDEVVCKITDRNGTLLYMNGSPAVYSSLKDGFEAYNAAGTYDFTYRSGGRATARRIEMLVDEHELGAGVELNRGKTVMLTTAPKSDTDGYAYTGEDGTVCVITRGEGCTGSMITNHSNLTLMNITLDGDGHRDGRDDDLVIITDGGIVKNAQTSAVLTIAEGATLRNSFVEGNGGAVNAIAGTTVYLTGGTISGNSSGKTAGTDGGNGNGAGIYLAKGSRLYLSGDPSFGDNFSDAELPENAKNGGETYSKARQDIYLAGATGEGEALTSITLTDNLPDDYPAGSIWVWAEGSYNTEPNHYYMLKQFAVVSFTKPISEATCKAFRNARADVDTDCGGDYLTGQTGDDIGTTRCLYWTGGFDFAFRKINGQGEALNDATFTLYTSAKTDDGKLLVPAMKDPKGTPIVDPYAPDLNADEWNAYQQQNNDATGTSAYIAATNAVTIKAFVAGNKPVDRAVYGDGLVVFEKIPPGNYFMVETTKPNTWNSLFDVYWVYVDGSGWISISGVKKDVSGKYQWPNATEDITVPADKPTVDFTKKGSDDKYTVAASGSTGTLKIYNIMNVSTLERKVILKKVNSGNAPLKDAMFTVYYADKQTVVKVSAKDSSGNITTKELKDLTSGATGVYWIGMLPCGTYYIHETSVPDTVKQSTDGWWYTLKVEISDSNGGITVSTQRTTIEEQPQNGNS